MQKDMNEAFKEWSRFELNNDLKNHPAIKEIATIVDLSQKDGIELPQLNADYLKTLDITIIDGNISLNDLEKIKNDYVRIYTDEKVKKINESLEQE